MPVTLEEVRAELERDEPNYGRAAKLGRDVLPHLDRLVIGGDVALASKAASLAGMIGTEEAVPVLEKAANSDDARVRVAAAHAARHLSNAAASRVLLPLVRDSDVGVQKVALNAVPGQPSAELRSSIQSMSESGADPAIRNLSREALRRVSH